MARRFFRKLPGDIWLNLSASEASYIVKPRESLFCAVTNMLIAFLRHLDLPLLFLFGYLIISSHKNVFFRYLYPRPPRSQNACCRSPFRGKEPVEGIAGSVPRSCGPMGSTMLERVPKVSLIVFANCWVLCGLFLFCHKRLR